MYGKSVMNDKLKNKKMFVKYKMYVFEGKNRKKNNDGSGYYKKKENKKILMEKKV
jgi:hypothetical protein